MSSRERIIKALNHKEQDDTGATVLRKLLDTLIEDYRDRVDQLAPILFHFCGAQQGEAAT